MAQFGNHYSLLMVLVGIVFVAALVLLTNKPKRNDFLSFGYITAGVVLAWVVLHPRQTPLMNDSLQVQQMIGAGTPVLLEFQSPYCISCTQVKPIVDDLEKEINGEVSIGKRLHIIRLNIQEQVAKDLGAVYGFEFTPTFIFFDAQGNEVWRMIGSFDPQRVRDSLP